MKTKLLKRVLSFLLVFALLLPMAPASWFNWVHASNEVVLYFNDDINWGQVYCYVWDSDDNHPLGDWPGTKLTQAEHYLYKAKVSTGIGIGVIFHNGNGTQTKNLSLTNAQVLDGYDYYIQGSDPYLFNADDPNTCWQKCRFPVENNGLVTI